MLHSFLDNAESLAHIVACKKEGSADGKDVQFHRGDGSVGHQPAAFTPATLWVQKGWYAATAAVGGGAALAL